MLRHTLYEAALAGEPSWCWIPMDASLQSQTVEAGLNKRSRPPSHISVAMLVTLRRYDDDESFALCDSRSLSLVALTSVAQARSAYDGSWDLLFVTQRGACDP